MHSNSSQSSPKVMPSTSASASDLSATLVVVVVVLDPSGPSALTDTKPGARKNGTCVHSFTDLKGITIPVRTNYWLQVPGNILAEAETVSPNRIQMKVRN